ncbi:sigma factor [cyanobacterium endosymbiont of Epithemia turgida]|uniref:sigma factor n=1 Tax=cyanobacterium endosymbiont of Epithemia turgida TaxID=718217 RepID=UPI001E4215D7|nr:sigma factor [cyanobacterium endosymbiont of Epithemia turgida]
MVPQVTYNVSNKCSELYEDLSQIGYLKLICTIEQFNPHQSHAFSYFAIPYIRVKYSFRRINMNMN